MFAVTVIVSDIATAELNETFLAVLITLIFTVHGVFYLQNAVLTKLTHFS